MTHTITFTLFISFLVISVHAIPLVKWDNNTRFLEYCASANNETLSVQEFNKLSKHMFPFSSVENCFAHALTSNNVKLLQLLLQADADATYFVSSKTQHTVLMAAISDNYAVEVIETIIKFGSTHLINFKNEHNETALDIASRFGNQQAISSLLTRWDTEITREALATDSDMFSLEIEKRRSYKINVAAAVLVTVIGLVLVTICECPCKKSSDENDEKDEDEIIPPAPAYCNRISLEEYEIQTRITTELAIKELMESPEFKSFMRRKQFKEYMYQSIPYIILALVAYGTFHIPLPSLIADLVEFTANNINQTLQDSGFDISMNVITPFLVAFGVMVAVSQSTALFSISISFMIVVVSMSHIPQVAKFTAYLENFVPLQAISKIQLAIKLLSSIIFSFGLNFAYTTLTGGIVAVIVTGIIGFSFMDVFKKSVLLKEVILVPSYTCPLMIALASCILLVIATRNMTVFKGVVISSTVCIALPLVLQYVIETFNLYKYSIAEFDKYVFFLIGGSYTNYMKIQIWYLGMALVACATWVIVGYVSGWIDTLVRVIVKAVTGTMCIAAALQMNNCGVIVIFITSILLQYRK